MPIIVEASKLLPKKPFYKHSKRLSANQQQKLRTIFQQLRMGFDLNPLMMCEPFYDRIISQFKDKIPELFVVENQLSLRTSSIERYLNPIDPEIVNNVNARFSIDNIQEIPL
jgi:hypothetical protein